MLHLHGMVLLGHVKQLYTLLLQGLATTCTVKLLGYCKVCLQAHPANKRGSGVMPPYSTACTQDTSSTPTY